MEIQKSKLAGAYVPQQAYDFISLYAVHKHKTKSRVIRDIIFTWMEECKFETADLEIVITLSIQSDWDDLKLSKLGNIENKIELFHNFQTKIRKDLEMKSIPEKSINNILKALSI